jgi:DNA-binding NarL/FixJ family response regulator
MTTVLVCDDRRRALGGLASQVAAVPGVTKVTTVATVDELLSRYASDRPRLVLVATGLRGGAPEMTRRLVGAYPEANVVVVAAGDDREGVVRALAGGARGFLQHDVSLEELCAALAHALVEIPHQVVPRAAADEAAPELTERELQVLRGMSEGKSNGQIGRELYLSEDTVKTHARRLFRKLGVNDRAQAVALGFRRGLVH